MARDLPKGHASADAGMVKIATLAVGDEFTFHPRRGRFRLTGLPASDLIGDHFGAYEPVDDEARSTTPARTVATRNWWVWPLDKDGS